MYRVTSKDVGRKWTYDGCQVLRVMHIKDGTIGKAVAELVEEIGIADEVIAISFQAQAVRDFRSVLPQSGSSRSQTLALAAVHERSCRQPR